MGAPIHTTANVNLRNAPNTSGTVLTVIPQGVSPDYNCWTQGQNIGGVDAWFNVNYNGHTGYYTSYYDDSSFSTDSQITSKYGIPQCGASGTITISGNSRLRLAQRRRHLGRLQRWRRKVRKLDANVRPPKHCYL